MKYLLYPLTFLFGLAMIIIMAFYFDNDDNYWS